MRSHSRKGEEQTGREHQSILRRRRRIIFLLSYLVLSLLQCFFILYILVLLYFYYTFIIFPIMFLLSLCSSLIFSCIFLSIFSIGNEQSRTIHESGVLPVQACRRPQSFLRKLQRLSQRTGVNAAPQAKCRSCCPPVAEQCCPRGAKSSVLRSVCCRR